jgi:PII-like signaling protein
VTSTPVTLVRVYLREGEHLLDNAVAFLRDERKVAGLTVQRGVLGIGEDGTLRTAKLLDLSLDLPLVLEFFDEPDKAKAAIEALLQRFDLAHVVALDATRYRR